MATETNKPEANKADAKADARERGIDNVQQNSITPTPGGTPVRDTLNQPGSSTVGITTGGNAAGDSDARRDVSGTPGVSVIPRSNAVEADHASVAKNKAEAEENAKKSKAARQRAKQDARGNMAGKWVSVGGTLVNVDKLAAISPPTEGDENPTLTLTLASGEKIVASGDDAEDIMEDLGIPKQKAAKNSAENHARVQENGDLITPKDRDADPARMLTVPDRSNRAAPPNPPVPASPQNPPTAPAGNAEPGDDSEGEGEGEGEDFHATGAGQKAEAGAKPPTATPTQGRATAAKPAARPAAKRNNR